MRKIITITLIAAFAAPAMASIDIPADLAGYFNRAHACAAVSGNDDRQAEAQILNCEELAEDKAAMQRKYGNDAELGRILAAN